MIASSERRRPGRRRRRSPVIAEADSSPVLERRAASATRATRIAGSDPQERLEPGPARPGDEGPATERRPTPAVGSMIPATTLKKVVLPAPLGPMMLTMPPFGMSRSTSRTATRPPNRLVTPRAWSRTSPLGGRAAGAAGRVRRGRLDSALIRAPLPSDRPCSPNVCVLLGVQLALAGAGSGRGPRAAAASSPPGRCRRAGTGSARKSMSLRIGTWTLSKKMLSCLRNTLWIMKRMNAPTATPQMLPMPPRTTMARTVNETSKRNRFGVTSLELGWRRKTPARPAVEAPRAKASSLVVDRVDAVGRRRQLVLADRHPGAARGASPGAGRSGSSRRDQGDHREVERPRVAGGREDEVADASAARSRRCRSGRRCTCSS